ncbi:DUF6368 family protein [Yinghuangia soli]|uniref:DUF6368 family protein n=1 Tax=Yinghuangia soli TaxID=2908204 RepID=A0AA41TZU0_9ACTN|nr:DUF6368 family protein [Yinghuangia soli]MCF2525707.1 DUF6368 family protein [Yinghuangia soli]
MGPAAVLWLREVRTAQDALPWIADRCDVSLRDDGSFEFTVRQPSAFGVRDEDWSTLGDFHLDVQPAEDFEDFDLPGLGRPPVAEMTVSAYCSGAANHLVLGQVAQILAARFDTVVDFNGLLGSGSYLPDEDSEHGRRAHLAEVDAFVAALPGRVWTLPYTLHGGSRWYSHVGDRDFLDAWLAHPRFHMI